MNIFPEQQEAVEGFQAGEQHDAICFVRKDLPGHCVQRGPLWDKRGDRRAVQRMWSSAIYDGHQLGSQRGGAGIASGG